MAFHTPATLLQQERESARYDAQEKQTDAERIYAENLARVSSPAYRKAERAVARAERSIRREVR